MTRKPVCGCFRHGQDTVENRLKKVCPSDSFLDRDTVHVYQNGCWVYYSAVFYCTDTEPLSAPVEEFWGNTEL